MALTYGGAGIVANFGPEDLGLSHWRLSDGRQLEVIPVDIAVFTMAGRSDGQALTLGNTDGHPKVMGKRGQQLAAFDAVTAAYSLSLSPDGRLLAAGLEDGHVQLWRVRDAALLATVYLGDGAQGAEAVALSPDDSALAASGSEAPLRLWNISRIAK